MCLKPITDILSFGGGVQSHAILVLIAQGRLSKPARIIMADTGRESRLTWEYIERITNPFLSSIGLRLEVAAHDLATVDLFAKSKVLLPMFTRTGRLPTWCSSEWKKLVLRRYIRSIGYGPSRPIRLWFGMSLDEVHRMRRSEVKWIENHYPLVFDVPMRREECKGLIENFGLLVPPKSACWMCPNRSDLEWMYLREHAPDDFRRAADLEKRVSARDKQGGLWLHRSRRPLAEVEFDSSEQLEIEWCTESCWT